jgi:hypothetical protein
VLQLIGNLAAIPFLRATNRPVEPVSAWILWTAVSVPIVGIGLYLAGRIGLGVPLVEGQLEGKEALDWARSVFALSLIVAIAGSVPFLLVNLNVDAWDEEDLFDEDEARAARELGNARAHAHRLRELEAYEIDRARREPVITRLDIIANLIASLERGDLTQEQLLLYLEDNAHILKSNIEQALLQHKKETIEAVLQDNLDRYAAAQETILANYRAFSLAADRATDQVVSTYGHDIPDIALVPCIGLFSNGGWKEQGNDTSYICVALERLSPTVHLDILLTHEVGHGIAETKWNTVLDGFYGEGHATYVSSVLCPGYPEEAYFFMDEAWLSSCLDWIEGNRDRIRQDASQPLQVLNPYHKLYFTTSFNPDHPNIGYVIGYLYLKHLHQEYTLEELRTFGKTDHPNQGEFASFISTWTRGSSADC